MGTAEGLIEGPGSENCKLRWAFITLIRQLHNLDSTRRMPMSKLSYH